MKSILFFILFSVGTINLSQASYIHFEYNGWSVAGWTLEGSAWVDLDGLDFNLISCCVSQIQAKDNTLAGTFTWANDTTTFVDEPSEGVVSDFTVRRNNENGNYTVYRSTVYSEDNDASDPDYSIVSVSGTSDWNAGISTTNLLTVQNASSGLPPSGSWSFVEVVDELPTSVTSPITNVPVPAAVWFFASSLIAIVSVDRLRKPALKRPLAID